MLYCRICGRPTEWTLYKEMVCQRCKEWKILYRRVISFSRRLRLYTQSRILIP
jgi:hypothetical protein